MKWLSAALFVVMMLLASTAFAVLMVGGQYRIDKLAVSAGGATSASASFRQSSLVGQTAIGPTVSAACVIQHGFWARPATSIITATGPELPPRSYKLDGAYPNPFNPSTRIRFELPESVRTRIMIYNLKGLRVRTLLDEIRPAGRHEVVWNGRDDGGTVTASGTYLLKMNAGAYAAQRKLALLK